VRKKNGKIGEKKNKREGEEEADAGRRSVHELAERKGTETD
jgi:hypothetical protein